MEVESLNYFELRNVKETDYENYILPDWLIETLSLEDKILDYGCGLGQMLIALKRQGYNNLKGADICLAAVDICKKNKLDVEQRDVYEMLEEYRGYFDVVILSHVLEHLDKSEMVQFLEKIKCLLLPQGKIVVMVPNAQSNTGCYWAYEDFTHKMLFTTGSLCYVLRAAGFYNIELVDDFKVKGGKMLSFRSILKIIRFFLLRLYILNKRFWNLVTESSFHRQSVDCYSYEIKAIARE